MGKQDRMIQMKDKDTDVDYRFAILRLMWDSHPWLTIGTAISGVISGFAGIAIIDTINEAIQHADRRAELMLVFFALVASSLFFRNSAALLPAYASRQIITSLRIALCKRILATPLQELDRRGTPNVLTLLTSDIPQLAATLLKLPTILVEATIVTFSMVYLAMLSWAALAWTLMVIVAGFFLFGYFLRRCIYFSQKFREEFNVFNSYTYGLLQGIKELKLNNDRRRWFRRAAIDLSTKRVANYNFIERFWYMGAESVSQISYFALIGILVFWAPSLSSLPAGTLTACVLTIIYLMEPLGTLVSTVPDLGKGAIACERLAEFGLSITDKDTTLLGNGHPGEKRLARQTYWESIELRNVCVNFDADNAAREFTLGPINLRLCPGELVFVIGGNGSGKSTLAKALTGLYEPAEGQIFLDNTPIEDPHRLEIYRNLFSAIFAEFHIFDRLIPSKGEDSVHSVPAQELLAKWGLEEKIQIQGNKLSTTTALSTGQRKRLALVCAYLEDRPIIILDEWAADQDPGFKAFFYQVLLPDLKKQGKCVIAITHDDHYFDLADRLVKLEDGRVIEVFARQA
jgi:putative ATP-binding cassette transporter